jgi:hypothetical protein
VHAHVSSACEFFYDSLQFWYRHLRHMNRPATSLVQGPLLVLTTKQAGASLHRVQTDHTGEICHPLLAAVLPLPKINWQTGGSMREKSFCFP